MKTNVHTQLQVDVASTEVEVEETEVELSRPRQFSMALEFFHISFVQLVDLFVLCSLLFLWCFLCTPLGKEVSHFVFRATPRLFSKASRVPFDSADVTPATETCQSLGFPP